jgi:hypothetical protein
MSHIAIKIISCNANRDCLPDFEVAESMVWSDMRFSF